MTIDVMLENPSWRSPPTTPATTVAPVLSTWGVIVIFCLAKNPFCMPRKSGATSMTPTTPTFKVTGVAAGVALELDEGALAPPHAASIMMPASAAVRRTIDPRISPPNEWVEFSMLERVGAPTERLGDSTGPLKDLG